MAANVPLHGVEGVYEHVAALLWAFPRVRFYCESVSVEGQYHAIVRWKARATNDGTFLGHAPLGTVCKQLAFRVRHSPADRAVAQGRK